jgi:CBS domain-containing protein
VNLAFFLTPVVRVEWLGERAAVAEAITRMGQHRYSAVPLLDTHGRYVGTLTEGDLLFYVAAHGGGSGTATLADVPRRHDHQAVGVDTDVRELLAVAADQNFVPVVDSRGVLMGIVTRKAILAQCERLLAEHGLLMLDGPAKA